MMKLQNNMARHSIKRQFAMIFGGLMAGTILLCFFINSTFLEDYYIQEKESALIEAYKSLNEASNNGNIDSDEFDIELQKIWGKYNISMVVIDADSETVKSTMNEPDISKRELLSHIFGEDGSMGGARNAKIIEQTDVYAIQVSEEPRTKTEYIEMWGMLDNGNFFLIRTALESIRDSVSISNRFLFYVGTLAMFVSCIIVWFVSKKITEPILELTNISEKMTHLDFEAKYTGNSKNEIGVLGEHVNQLSANLEKTISELKTANNELKRDIAEKTQIDVKRQEFISNVSHELKTPIALIQGYAEGLREGIHDDEESKDFYCDVIMDETSKMNIMVKKLLTLNQLESGNDVITMERFDIITLISNYLQSAEILTKPKDIQVRMDHYDSLYVWGDEFKTEEVFMNFFTNAVNHCDGDKVIDVKVIKKDGKAHISIFNTGEAIPEESINQIWDKFYKVDKARTREYGGSGVGLSIVKAIMESMNEEFGILNFKNGVEFWFELECNCDELKED